MFRQLLPTIVLGSSLLGSLARISAAGELPPLPLLGLTVGQELRYEVQSACWFDGPDGKPQISRGSDGAPKFDNHELFVFVTANNSDGSFHVILKRRSSLGHPFLSDAELFPDGRLVRHPETMPTLEEDGFRAVFPVLPSNGVAAWQELEERTGVRVSFKREGNEIQAVLAGPLDRVASGATKLRYRLDPKSGLPTRVESGGYWKDYGETHEGRIILKGIEQHGAAWANEMHAEARAYFAAEAKSRRLTSRGNSVPLAIAARNSEGIAPVFDEARRVLAAANDAARQPIVRGEFERALKDFDKYRATREAGVKGLATLAGQAALPWKAADLTGRERALEDYRDKVLVLDFWFRKCSYCIRAMPQVEEAAEHFRRAKAPVEFIGICTDEDPADARHVADVLKLTSPIILDKSIADKYGIDRFPRLLVIDPLGNVQGIFGGYNLSLREDLIECVAGLLKKGPVPVERGR